MTASSVVSSSKSTTTTTIVAPSALNVYKKIAVVRSVEDTLHYDVDGTIKTVSVQELGDAISTATPLVVPRPKLEIPVPHLTINETYHRDVPPNYELPRSYVRYHKVSAEEFMDRLDYVADQEDEDWLCNNAKFGAAVNIAPPVPEEKEASGESSPKEIDDAESTTVSTSLLLPARMPQLSIKLLETMLDVLEKKTAFDSIVSTQQAEEYILLKIPHLVHMFPAQLPRARPADGSKLPATLKAVIQDVYNYWVQKRSKLKRPLLRNYWPVTSTEDTNPHLVFRPREKEKYRLRKKRQNDLFSFQKLQQLRNDFDSLRTVLGLVKRREELKRTQTQLQIDLFQQRLFEVVDTSDRPRLSTSSKVAVKRELDDQSLMDVRGRKNKRARNAAGSSGRAFEGVTGGQVRGGVAGSGPGLDGHGQDASASIAGRNFGDPAPHFLHPLKTRETYATSYDGTVPNVATFVDSHLETSVRFRHRPRIGRGGRLCIDRIPVPTDPNIEPLTIVTVGKGLSNYVEPKASLLDLMPRPLNRTIVSRRIENICLAAVRDDAERANQSVLMDHEDNDGAEILVDTNRWLDTDDQLWGEERFSLYLK